jgi:hypothetical protein
MVRCRVPASHGTQPATPKEGEAGRQVKWTDGTSSQPV